MLVRTIRLHVNVSNTQADEDYRSLRIHLSCSVCVCVCVMIGPKCWLRAFFLTLNWKIRYFEFGVQFALWFVHELFIPIHSIAAAPRTCTRTSLVIRRQSCPLVHFHVFILFVIVTRDVSGSTVGPMTTDRVAGRLEFAKRSGRSTFLVPIRQVHRRNLTCSQ